MCGIAGKVYFSKNSISSSDLVKMTQKIVHRGPDDAGIFISKDRKVGLANRRLAIIDLSKKGHQPMNYMNRYWITTNGEIYNFQQEKEKLQKIGYKFNSGSDTEVILALYDKYREKCLEHLRGMFAFCIYDSVKETVFLARDRIGVKPLKYFMNDQLLVFASEIKSILSQREVRKAPDYNALQKYLIYGYIPAPQTGFLGIQKLEPGHYLHVDLKTKKTNKKTYWQPSFKNKLDLSENQWCEKILETLEDSTRLRMISDVPVGAFLSGGVDSSGIVAMMAKLSKKPINTFTITFADKKWDEAKYARKIAKIYKTNHVELRSKPIDIEILPEVAYYFEEPFADAGALVSYTVSKLARKFVTVILNGDGGDENFAGYPNRYFRLKRDVDFFKWITVIRPAALSTLKAFGKISNTKIAKRSEKFLEKSKLPLFKRFSSYNQIFQDEDLQTLWKNELGENFTPDNLYEPIKSVFQHFEGSDLKDAGLKFDLMYWLPDDLLAKADLMSMANSIEGRSPFLDYKLVELASQIPFNLKTKGGESKYILKKALEKIVPKENLYRQKRGFGLPLDEWFSGKLNLYAKSVLLNKRSKTKDLINQQTVKHMLNTHSKDRDYGPKLWTLLTLELWFDQFFN